MNMDDEQLPTWEECKIVDYVAIAWTAVEETYSPYAYVMYRLLARLWAIEELWRNEEEAPGPTRA